jgi:tetratricopeptide (TPR) repeat protein
LGVSDEIRSKNRSATVTSWTEDIILPTYLPAEPDKNPMFLERRVYQGSSGKVYPLPFTDRIAEKAVERKWRAVWLENEFVRIMVLPEIGGRIHRAMDKTNGYDFIYYQSVIKPALVGLAGPWISGGIEFNWAQHHRPATFLPVDYQIEQHDDGSVTIWCSDHDPMARMKGMHGICLHPGKSYVELRVRAYNRTPFVQTFLWWANVATRVHAAYQSFFPPDVYYVADHAKRAMSQYPLCEGVYYGVNYRERGQHGVPVAEMPSQFVPPHCDRHPASGNGNGSLTTGPAGEYRPNDLSWYANIPVPTSYMCMGSKEDFFGGYDYKAQAGLVHIANHHICPGKKQWTWGNHEFGYAWDRNLTDPDEHGEYGPYIELMAGVYTDNQPDFSFLQPGETKKWSQFWYPIRNIGAAQHANLDAAISLTASGSAGVRLGVSVTARQLRTVVTVTAKDKQLALFHCDLSPAQPLVQQIKLPAGVKIDSLQIRVTGSDGRELIAYQPRWHKRGEVPPPATEPPAPRDIRSADELFITGLHLEQYRHATRCPTIYWQEALRRDPLDARCNNAMGLWHLKRGEFGEAEQSFRKAIERLTRRNPNPYDGEAYYNLGLCLRYQARDDDAYDAFYKATWNQAWAAAGYHALAEIDCTRNNWPTALDHLDRSLRFDTDNLRARDLKVLVLRKLGETSQAASMLRETRRLDRLDWWARHLDHEPLGCDLQTQLDIAHDYARAGFYAEAIELLHGPETQIPVRPNGHPANGANNGGRARLPDQSWGALPLVHYTLGWLEQKRGDDQAARQAFKVAGKLAPDYCFPARLEEIAIFEQAMRANPADAKAPYYLGNLLYDRRRQAEALKLWEKSAQLDPSFSVVWRNLGMGYFNIRHNARLARKAYNLAFCVNPADARLLYERDQLWKRLGEKPEKRLRELEKHPDLVELRDDLSVELCALYNQNGQHEQALMVVNSRKFQPWEGGEGGPLGQHVRSHLSLGRAALGRGEAAKAREHFEAALTAPRNLGEAKHLLANQSDIHFWLGCALTELGDQSDARHHWLAAANFRGDFQAMSVRAFSELTYYSALSLEKLGQMAQAKKLCGDLLVYAKQLQKMKAKIDYFATSLPTMLLFNDDLQFRQETTAFFLQAQAQRGLGRTAKSKALLKKVLERDPNHARAADLSAKNQKKS